MVIKKKKKKTIIFVFSSIYFYLIFFLVYIISILLLTYDMVTDLEYFIFIAFTLKFGVKSLLSEGSHRPAVYVSPCSLALV